ncbi:hypothetical protein D7V97_22270 [Corallococcus sp. CA053C]|uniref:hypothetical protein n=1 Tax=Corallococcus sp. CA053C TaxID=2316732 RepID=UPI000EA09814|nr:hypothetical protein [Corallococcus sp. CA053C]RKH06701.1 hypothetical protein D7V97_22270 [Corallococcus sp. CA053C]
MQKKKIDGVVFGWTWEYQVEGTNKAFVDGKPENVFAATEAEFQKDDDHPYRYVVVSSPNINVRVTLEFARTSEDDERPVVLGASNTIYTSRKSYYYDSKVRSVLTQKLTRVPCWDGFEEQDESDLPFYSGPQHESTEAHEEGIEVYFNDAPRCGPNGFAEKFLASTVDPTEHAKDKLHRNKNKPETLFWVEGYDSYKLWLVARIDDKPYALDGFPWFVKYAARVDPENDQIVCSDDSRLGLGRHDHLNKKEPCLTGKRSGILHEVEQTTWIRHPFK